MSGERDSLVAKPTASDMDSLHILPLSIMPLKTSALKRARLIKNNRFETTVELFRDRVSGSGQIAISDIVLMLESEDGEELRADINQIEKLGRTPSFDVYSTRIGLRNMDFDVDESEHLTLSETKRAELSERMATFTRPLVQHVFGQDASPLEDAADLSKLLRNPDKEETIRRLTQMADSLAVRINEIPKFIEDYGDIFLSLAYFREILDEMVPKLTVFQDWLGDLRSNWIIKNDRAQDRIIRGILDDLNYVSSAVTTRFDIFDKQTEDFWRDINAERFRDVRRLITTHHRAVGGMLCGLMLKMDAWSTRFPDPAIGGPQSKVEFTYSEILPGLEQIKSLGKP